MGKRATGAPNAKPKAKPKPEVLVGSSAVKAAVSSEAAVSSPASFKHFAPPPLQRFCMMKAAVADVESTTSSHGLMAGIVEIVT